MTKGPVCIFCKNFSSKSKPGSIFCKAFPEGIPKEIWSGDHSHNRPFAGDNGIIYEDNGGIVELEENDMLPYMKCGICKHYTKWEVVNGKVADYCKAFPEGIPQEILDNKNDHTSPYPGDNGIMFEPIEDIKEK